MSAGGYKQTFSHTLNDVRFVPESGHHWRRVMSRCPNRTTISGDATPPPYPPPFSLESPTPHLNLPLDLPFNLVWPGQLHKEKGSGVRSWVGRGRVQLTHIMITLKAEAEQLWVSLVGLGFSRMSLRDRVSGTIVGIRRGTTATLVPRSA